MDDQLSFKMPVVSAATISPNPATINSSATLSVTVTEQTVILYPQYFYSGEIYAGEV